MDGCSDGSDSTPRSVGLGSKEIDTSEYVLALPRYYLDFHIYYRIPNGGSIIMHNSLHADTSTEAGHGTLWSYTMGFVLSIVLP